MEEIDKDYMYNGRVIERQIYFLPPGEVRRRGVLDG